MKKLKDEFTPSVMEAKRVIKEVMKIYIPPKTTPVDEESDTESESDSESEKLDIAEEGKSESED